MRQDGHPIPLEYAHGNAKSGFQILRRVFTGPIVEKEPLEVDRIGGKQDEVAVVAIAQLWKDAPVVQQSADRDGVPEEPVPGHYDIDFESVNSPKSGSNALLHQRSR